MAKRYKILRDRMSSDARESAAIKTEHMLAEMPLQELRQARQLSQEQLARIMNVKQAAVSKMERRTDMYISTLREFIRAMGGDLKIIAHFPDGDIQVDQFAEVS